MLKFLTFAVKVQLNVHDLNNEAVAGNVTDIRIIEFLDEEGKRVEAPAVSGRMLKHWHFEGMRSLITKGPYTNVSLCAGCKSGEPIRPGEIMNNRLVQVVKSEKDAITSCAVCDIHGYLIAQDSKNKSSESEENTENEKEEKGKKEAKQKSGISARRISRSMFSWLMPVLRYDTTTKQVIHNRVSSDSSVMMPFNKSYASGIYAFVSALDVDRIGLFESNVGEKTSNKIDYNNVLKERIKVAIEAYRFMLSGQIGASLSHAIPHVNPIEILVAYSETGPLPFPVSPMYSDYIEKTSGLVPQNTVILYWGDESPTGVNKKNTINEIFDELLGKVV